MTNKSVTVIWSNDAFHKDVVRIGADGVGHVHAPADARMLSVFAGPKDGSGPYRIAFLDCNEPQLTGVLLDKVLESGYVPKNRCSKRSTSTAPGEIVFWGSVKPWWSPDWQ